MDETGMLQLAQKAIEQGELPIAGKYLKQILENNPRNDSAWVMIASITNNPEKKIEFLKRALKANPANEIARQRLAKWQNTPPPHPESKPKPIPQPIPKTTPEPEPELEPIPVPQPKPGPGTEPGTGLKPKPEPGPEPKKTSPTITPIQNPTTKTTTTQTRIPANPPPSPNKTTPKTSAFNLNTIVLFLILIMMGFMLLKIFSFQKKLQSIEELIDNNINIFPDQGDRKPNITKPETPTQSTSGNQHPAKTTSETPISDKTSPTSIEKEEIQKTDKKAEIITKSPNPITNAVVAGSGNYIILKMENLPGLTVYSTFEKKFIHTFRLDSDNILYTAGGDAVLVYYPETNLLQSWSLVTYDKLMTKSNPKGVIITNMTMGHSNTRYAFIRYCTKKEPLGNASLYILDVERLKELTIPSDKKPTYTHNTSYRDFVHHRTDGMMRKISEWCTSNSPTGLGLFTISGRMWTFKYEHESEGYIAVGDDGFLYTQTGKIYNSQLTETGDIPGSKLIPAIGGSFFLGIADDGSMQVYASESTTPIGPLDKFPGLDNEQIKQTMSGAWAKTSYTFDCHIVFDPTHSYIVIIPPENDRIITRSFELKDIMEDSGVDFLVVTSTPNATITIGETFQYKIETLSNASKLKYYLKFAPDDMAIDNTGLITWKVPEDYASNLEKVVVLIENENGDSIYHNFDLYIRD